MDLALPHYENPPLIEVVASVQFGRIVGLGSTQLARFWEQSRVEFGKVVDAEPLLPQHELFGKERMRPRRPQIRLGADPSLRLQMISADDSTVVQIQNGRVVYNWRRTPGSGYPRWSIVRPAFLQRWTAFTQFLESEGLGTPTANQWEVVYVNHFHRGEEWTSTADWPQLVPGLMGRTDSLVGCRVEGFTAMLQAELEDRRGRLHIELQHALAVVTAEAAAEHPGELLVLQLTARGPLGNERTIEEGLELGHSSIVRNFATITGEAAQRRWGRIR